MIGRRARALGMSLLWMMLACDRGGEVKPVEPMAAPPPDLPPPVEIVRTPIPTPKPPDAGDVRIAPGERVGPITRDTDRARLTVIYGEKALQDTTLTLDDGTRETATRIRRGDKDSATVIWWDPNREKVKEVRDFGADWRTPEGVGMGADIATLEAAVGTFKIYGFGWDYAGTVDLEGTRYSRYRDRLYLRMAPKLRDPAVLGSASGDRQYSSTEEEMRRVGPTVAEMVVSLEPLPVDDSD